MRITLHELADAAEYIDESSFRLNAHPDWLNGREIPTGLYELPRRSSEAHLYRLNHSLGDAVIERAKSRELPSMEIFFDLSNHSGKISILESLRGLSGWLAASVFTVDTLDQTEDHILLSAISDTGAALSDDASIRLLKLGAQTGSSASPTPEIIEFLNADLSRRRQEIQRSISERNGRFFEEEAEKLDGWADDLKIGLEREIKDIDRQIKESRRAAVSALTLEEKLAGQKHIKSLEALRTQKRRSLFDAQDEIDKQRSELIAQIEGKLAQKTEQAPLFIIHWTLR
jgi:adenine-specific DNA-methyltransferase